MLCKSLQSQLLVFWKEQINCDVYFHFKNTKTKIGAHKLILALVSDVFNVMFYGESSQRGLFNQKEPIIISDIEPETFRMFLDFIYGAEVKFETAQEVVNIYAVAHKYNCIDAMNVGKEHMRQTTTLENSIPFYEVADLYNISDLKAICLKLFSYKTLRILNSEEFLDATPSTVETIFALETTTIKSEMDYVNALEAYIKYNEGVDKDIREKIKPALYLIRFLTLNAGEIAQTTLLTDVEARKIIVCLHKNNLDEMPINFSTNKTKRSHITAFDPSGTMRQNATSICHANFNNSGNLFNTSYENFNNHGHICNNYIRCNQILNSLGVGPFSHNQHNNHHVNRHSNFHPYQNATHHSRQNSNGNGDYGQYH